MEVVLQCVTQCFSASASASALISGAGQSQKAGLVQQEL